MENESAFPRSFRDWDDDNKEYFQDSTDGLTKLELISAIILSQKVSRYNSEIENNHLIKDSIELASLLLQKINE